MLATHPAHGASLGKTKTILWWHFYPDSELHDTLLQTFAEERPAPLPLPIEPFPCYQYGEPVRLDGCVEVEAAYYGAPPGWIGRRLAPLVRLALHYMR